jgi:hypothetical protein
MNKKDQKAFDEALIHASLNTNAVMNPGDFNKGFSKGWDAAWLAAKAHYSTNTAAPDEVKEIFEYWQAVMNKPRARAIPKAKIKARLKNYSVQDIKQAIDGCRASAFHMGDNDGRKLYNGLDLICRNDSKLEEFMEMTKPVLAISQEPEKKSISEMLRGQSIDSDQCINSYDGGLLIEHDNTGQR